MEGLIMKRKIIFAIPFALLLFLVLGTIQVQTVFASYILGYNEDAGGGFQNFNLDDNSTTDLKYGGASFSELESLTYGGGNTYYGIESFNDAGTDSTLYSFELDGGTVTGTASENTIDASNIDAATFVDGLLYAFDNDADKLMTINLDGSKGGDKRVRGLGNKKIEGLAYAGGGLLYASATRGRGRSERSWLYRMNLDGTDLQELGEIQGYGQVEALTFLDDVLYGVGNKGGNPLIQINTASGKVFGDPISWGSGDIEGIAAGGSAAVPEPATVLLLGFGLLGFAGSGIKKLMGKLRREAHSA
jgi:hypothetical protein